MDPHHTLSAGVARLTRALDDPGADLAAGLHRLGEDFNRAVEAYIGLALVVTPPTITTTAVHLTTREDAAAHNGAQSSLFIPLRFTDAAVPDSGLIAFSGIRGAFTDLADHLRSALGLPPNAVTLDQHLHHYIRVQREGLSGLVVFSLVNQAIGVLIGHGHTREQAERELRRLAAEADGDLQSAAATVVDAAGPGSGLRLV